jgi:hypothetical protein
VAAGYTLVGVVLLWVAFYDNFTFLGDCDVLALSVAVLARLSHGQEIVVKMLSFGYRMTRGHIL